MIHWGILGMGKIAKRFIKSLAYSEEGKLEAVASYTLKKREEIMNEYPDIKVYDHYEDLLNDPDIDVVYIAMRHNDHYQWAKYALEHQKHVLCEKPATLSYQQTKELCDLAKKHQVLFLEGMKTRFIPLVDVIQTTLQEGIIGDILRIETAFCSDVPYDEKSYLFDQDQGGALYDVGIYNIATILDYIHSPVVSIESQVQRAYGVDVNDRIELTFENQATALIEIATNMKKEKGMVITGTKGTLKAQPFYRPQRAEVFCDEGTHILEKPYIHDDFYTEILEVHHCIHHHLVESARMSHQDSLQCIALIERIKESFAWSKSLD